MQYVYIAYALEDGDEVGPLAEMLRGAGYGVRFSALIEPGGNHRERIEAQIRRAAAVLAVWSSNSVASPRVRSDVEFARQEGNLIAVRIDAASVPLVGGTTVDLSDGQHLASGPGAQTILAAISAVSGLPPAASSLGPVSEARGAPGPAAPTRNWKGAAALLGVAVLGLGALAVSMLLPQTRGGSETELVGSVPLGGLVPTVETGSSGARVDALEMWGSVARDDPTALRAFLAQYGTTPVAEQARGALSRLERAAWAELETRNDSAGVLAALDVYRADFPDGLFMEEAGGIERRERGRIAEVQQLLKAAGIGGGEADGILRPETVTAVTTFQASVGLAPTGLIDGGLIQALRSFRAPLPGAAAAPAPRAAAITPSSSAPSMAASPVRDCYVCPELVPLPPGRFIMGDATGAATADERPAHEVTIAYRLAVGRYEVTFEEWDACLAEGGCRHRPDDAGLGRGNRPVVNISPADVSEYLGWLTRKTGKKYRLLSEAEWEYAARAGTSSAWHSGNDPAVLCGFGNGADASSTYAWRNSACSDRFAGAAAPVGSFRPNAFGLHDMIGNVWEWVSDCWHSSYAAAPADGSAWLDECDATDNILRGGAYSVELDKLRSSYRYHFAPRRMPFFGFRVARQFD